MLKKNKLSISSWFTIITVNRWATKMKIRLTQPRLVELGLSLVIMPLIVSTNGSAHTSHEIWIICKIGKNGKAKAADTDSE